jgi:hypothetical protein
MSSIAGMSRPSAAVTPDATGRAVDADGVGAARPLQPTWIATMDAMIALVRPADTE